MPYWNMFIKYMTITHTQAHFSMVIFQVYQLPQLAARKLSETAEMVTFTGQTNFLLPRQQC